MADTNLQKELFDRIRHSLPANVSMVAELTELLNLSYDSIYRRIRGEKPLQLDELKLLCGHYRLSLDQVLQLQSDKVLFTDNEVSEQGPGFKEYMQGLLQQLQHFNSFAHRQLFYLSKDVPVFYFFYFKELAAFKSFFWSRSILNDPAFEKQHFSLAGFDADEYFLLGQQILQEYNRIPSTELWNYESIISTILQIQYYSDAGLFETTADLNKVVDSCSAMLQHLEHQLQKGCKFMPGAGEAGYGAPLKFYVNELILGNNSILVETGDVRTTFINHIVLKYISTTDTRFTEKAFQNFQNLVSRSVLISQAGEKDRTIFFKTLQEKLQACKK